MTSRVHAIPLGRSKAFVVQGDRAILVDTGMPGDEQRIVKALRDLGIEPESLSLIVITHAHRDHTGGLAALREMTGAPVAVHDLEAGVLKEGIDAPIVPNGLIARVLVSLIRAPKPLPGVTADLTIREPLDLRNYGVNGEIVPTPGHTPGSISLVLPNGEAIIGDLVMRGLSPRPALPLLATSEDEVRESLQELIARGVTRFLAAHGGPFSVSDIERRLLR